MRHKIVWACVLLLVPLFAAPAAAAQSPIVVTSQTHELNFPKSMRFTLQAQSDSPIQLARLTVWQGNIALGSRFTLPFTPNKTVRVAYEWNFQSFGFDRFLPPGTHGEYTWRLEDAAGNVLDTPHQTYVIQDPSQKWRVLSNNTLRVSWHSGGPAFGKALMDRAISAQNFFAHELQINDIDPLEIFIYADTQEFFDSLPPSSYEWTGGRTFPEYGVIMINIAPDNLGWGLRATSHELSHAILHAKIRGTIGVLSLPLWLDEGLAVYNETDDHAPDDHFEAAYQTALRRDTLIPLRSMQLRFPSDSNQAQLAYGQSYAVVKFMIDEYGPAKFAELLDTYQNGALPDDGLARVYGMNQDELENAWRAKIGVPLRDVSNSVLPTIAPRPTFEFSSPLSTSPAPTRESLPTPEPTRVSVVATPASGNAIPAQTPDIPSGGLCGGALALGGFVTFSLLKRRRLK